MSPYFRGLLKNISLLNHLLSLRSTARVRARVDVPSWCHGVMVGLSNQARTFKHSLLDLPEPIIFTLAGRIPTALFILHSCVGCARHREHGRTAHLCGAANGCWNSGISLGHTTLAWTNQEGERRSRSRPLANAAAWRGVRWPRRGRRRHATGVVTPGAALMRPACRLLLPSHPHLPHARHELCRAVWRTLEGGPVGPHCAVCLRVRAFISLSLLRVPALPPDPACGVATMANMHFSGMSRRKLCHAV